MNLPFSQASENNKSPILAILKRIFSDREKVLEIGSGTGQHAEYFAKALAHLQWQPSDVADHLEDIQTRLDTHQSQALSPLELDMNKPRWPSGVDAVFSANTAHIMAWPLVEIMCRGVSRLLQQGGLFVLYGPFNYNGQFTSASNKQFEQWLKGVDPTRGIRDFEALDELLASQGMQLLEDNSMPANNRLLVWVKSEGVV